MRQLKCEMCGSTDLLKQDGVFVCQSCGCKYSVEEAKKMMIEGTVEITGTVKIDQNTELQNNLLRASREYKEKNFGELSVIADRILAIDANNVMGVFYKGASKVATINKENNQINVIAKYFESANKLNDDGDLKLELFQKFTETIDNAFDKLLKICEQDNYINSLLHTERDRYANRNRDVSVFLKEVSNIKDTIIKSDIDEDESFGNSVHSDEWLADRARYIFDNYFPIIQNATINRNWNSAKDDRCAREVRRTFEIHKIFERCFYSLLLCVSYDDAFERLNKLIDIRKKFSLKLDEVYKYEIDVTYNKNEMYEEIDRYNREVSRFEDFYGDTIELINNTIRKKEKQYWLNHREEAETEINKLRELLDKYEDDLNVVDKSFDYLDDKEYLDKKAELEKLISKKSELISKLNSLGIFSIAEKKKTQEKIDEINTMINLSNQKIDDIKKTNNERKAQMKNEISGKRKEVMDKCSLIQSSLSNS